MTDRDRILAEIERLKKASEEFLKKGGEEYLLAQGGIDVADEIIRFINSLPEEPEQL